MSNLINSSHVNVSVFRMNMIKLDRSPTLCERCMQVPPKWLSSCLDVCCCALSCRVTPMALELERVSMCLICSMTDSLVHVKHVQSGTDHSSNADALLGTAEVVLKLTSHISHLWVLLYIPMHRSKNKFSGCTRNIFQEVHCCLFVHFTVSQHMVRT